MTQADDNAATRDDAGGPAPSGDAAALDEARNAVLHGLQQTVEQGNVPDEDAAALVSQIRAFTDVFALDEWVFEQPLLKKRFCRYPLCFNPPRPPREQSEGRRRGGNPPAYCATGVDHEGQLHNGPFASMRSMRRREQLRAQARNAPAAPTAPAPVGLGGDHLIGRAHDDMAHRVTDIVRGLDELTREVAGLREIAAATADDEARRAELETVRHQARELIGQETGRRLDAEHRARDARAAVHRLENDLGEANAAVDDAAREVELAHTERDEARDRAAQIGHEADRLRADTARRLDETQAAARWLLAEAQWNAENTVAEIRGEAERRLAERQEETDRLVRAAQDSARQVAAAAAQREDAAAREVAAAEQALAQARAALDKAEAAAQDLTRVNIRLREEAVARERDFEQRIAALRADFERHHNELRDKLERDLTERLAQARQSADALHQAETAALATANELLSTKLHAATAELTALRDTAPDITRS